MQTGKRPVSDSGLRGTSVLAAAALLACGCATPPEEAPVAKPAPVRFQTSIDAGGCRVEHVAVEPGRNQFQYDGLSPDGSILAVAWDRGDGDRGAYLLDLTTGERTELPGLNEVATFAPSGATLLSPVPVENGRTDLFEYDLSTGDMRVIARHEAWDWFPSYSSDGESIVFNSYRTGGSDIYTYDRASGELERRTDDPRYEAAPQYSPDDSKILFHRQMEENNYDVFVLDAANGEITQLTRDESEESYASWSPDGTTIVFASDRSPTSQGTDLYLMNADGSEIRQLTEHPSRDGYPFFSPDGRHIYFSSDRDPPGGLYRIALDANLECSPSPG